MAFESESWAPGSELGSRRACYSRQHIA